MMFKPDDSNSRKNMKTAVIKGGFSLFEILIVLIVLGIVSSMGAYAWQRFVANNNLRTAARDIAADIALYRQKAVGQNDDYTVTFDIANNNYTITHAKDPDATVKSPSVFGADIRLETVTFGSDTINIKSRGLVGTGSITIKNSRGSSAKIRVSSAGRTNLQFTMK
jgi:prepilin-type N-terminal cleavage/methylation domain-containing protein